MYPMYRHMDSYPQPRPYVPYHPSFESIPYQMKPDSAKSPSPYESWPYSGSNYCYPYPMECHGCYNHNYFPGYCTFRPPYPHFPPPPPQPFHCHGSYTPHPHYPMELPPRYEHDKNTPWDPHCCGCPNHSCARKEDQNVKIDEPDPDVQKKSSGSLVPHQLRNYPYPIVWIPPGSLKNKDEVKGKPIELELKDKERNVNSKSFEQEPSFWNGWWLPLDMSRLGSLKEDGDGRKIQHQRNDDEGRSPFQIFRMHYKPEELERNGLRENNVGQEYVNKLPSHFSITPLDVSDTEDLKNKSLPRGSEENYDSVRKMIPEKAEKGGEKKTSKETEGKAKSIPVEFRNDIEERKPASDSGKRWSCSSSPPKLSKLPPVCLRVDPLPRRKNSSRSPSPPANKGKSEKSTNENSKSSNLPSRKENLQENMRSPEQADKSKEVEQIESKAIAIEVAEAPTSKAGNDNEECVLKVNKVVNDSKNGKYGSEELTEAKNEIVGQSGDGKCETGDGKVERNATKEKAGHEVNKPEKKILSDAEAAVIIQSAYRGFEVRKWEPLNKLKQIAKVKERAAEVKSSIQALESSSNVQSDDKQRLVIGETIMNLLLKLDTIQGLHPSIRDIRKSLARELVSLQEKLDLLTTKKPEASIEEAFAAKPMEDISTTTNSTEAVETSEPMLIDKEVCGDLEDKSTEEPVANDAVSHKVDSLSLLEPKDDEALEEQKDKVPDVANHEDLEIEENASSEELLKEVSANEEPKGEFRPESKEENDEKLLREARDGPQENSAEAQGEEVNNTDEPGVMEDKIGKDEEVLLRPLEDETTNTNNVALALEIEELKPELPHVEEENDEKILEATNTNDVVLALETVESKPELACVEEENDEKLLEEARLGVEEQPEEAQREEFDHTNEPGVVVVETTGKVYEYPVQPLEDEVKNANDAVQAFEAEEPQKKLPCEDDEVLGGEFTDTQADERSSGLKDSVLVEKEEEVLNGDQESAANNTIEQPGDATEEIVPHGRDELIETDRKLREENEKLKEMVEKLVEAGKEQLSALSILSGKVKDLERKLSKKKKLTMRKCAKRSHTYDDQMVF